jgi:hypothetical protein
MLDLKDFMREFRVLCHRGPKRSGIPRKDRAIVSKVLTDVVSKASRAFPEEASCKKEMADSLQEGSFITSPQLSYSFAVDRAPWNHSGVNKLGGFHL